MDWCPFSKSWVQNPTADHGTYVDLRCVMDKILQDISNSSGQVGNFTDFWSIQYNKTKQKIVVNGYLSLYLSISLSIYLSIHPSIYLSLSVYVYVPAGSSIYTFTYTYIYIHYVSARVWFTILVKKGFTIATLITVDFWKEWFIANSTTFTLRERCVAHDWIAKKMAWLDHQIT